MAGEKRTPQVPAPSTPRISPFEAIRHEDEEGGEYWSARELARVLDYTDWRNFRAVIRKAMQACTGSGYAVVDHFVAANEMVTIGSGAQRTLENWHLSRHACYLAVQNADPDKPQVALGQTYFAVQTRRQELLELGAAEPDITAVARLRGIYRKKGYSDEWIERRIEKIIVRTGVTAEWGNRGAHEGKEFAHLTDTLSTGTFDITRASTGRSSRSPAGRTYRTR